MTVVDVTASVGAQHAAPLQNVVCGRLEATFTRRHGPLPDPFPDEGGVMVRFKAEGPLELRRPVVHDDRFFLRNVTAGVFGGDSYDVSLTCEAGASARVESTSATKVHAMPGAGAISQVHLRAEAGALLVWGPHATILHADSEYASETLVELGGGIVVVAETVGMGRLASGEAFAFHRFESAMTVSGEGGRVLFRERASLVPSPTLRDAMGGRGVLTTVYGLGVEPDETMTDRLTNATLGFDLAGWSLLPNGAGVVAKALVEGVSRGDAFARACLKALLPPPLSASCSPR